MPDNYLCTKFLCPILLKTHNSENLCKIKAENAEIAQQIRQHLLREINRASDLRLVTHPHQNTVTEARFFIDVQFHALHILFCCVFKICRVINQTIYLLWISDNCFSLSNSISKQRALNLRIHRKLLPYINNEDLLCNVT